MPEIAHTASDMISGMSPELRPGSFVFASVDEQVGAGLMARAVSMFREDEGLSLLLPAKVAETAGLPVDQPMRCITLNVYSSLEGVGLTAAVATALAENGIACNMVAAFHHDHAFVPEALSDKAMQVLKELQTSG